MLELLVDNKNGNVWDIGELVTDVSWTTVRIGEPGKFNFSFIKDADFKVNNGDIVRAKVGDQKVFYGYVFSVSSGRDPEVAVSCYDQLRYLAAKDTKEFKNMTAAAIVKKLAAELKLKVGPIVDTRYKIPLRREEDKTYFDMICTALDLTLINTGKLYFMYDDFGNIMVQDTQNMVLDLIVGDGSLAYDFKYTTSIDDDTYNYIKLVRVNKEAGKREAYVAKDSSNMARWGTLKYFDEVDENMNSAQINQQLNMLLELKNRESKTLKIDALGDLRVRAGCYVNIILEELGLKQIFLVDECTHKDIGAPHHTMSLDLRVV